MQKHVSNFTPAYVSHVKMVQKLHIRGKIKFTFSYLLRQPWNENVTPTPQ